MLTRLRVHKYQLLLHHIKHQFCAILVISQCYIGPFASTIINMISPLISNEFISHMKEMYNYSKCILNSAFQVIAIKKNSVNWFLEKLLQIWNSEILSCEN